jgi:hypothetical protein
MLYTVRASDRAGDVSLELGVKYLDEQQVEYYVFDLLGSAGLRNLDREAAVDAHSVRATFPASEIDRLGGRFRWRAALDVDGRDADLCPDPGEDGLNPTTLPFPS